jgi:hypothetical protein
VIWQYTETFEEYRDKDGPDGVEGRPGNYELVCDE